MNDKSERLLQALKRLYPESSPNTLKGWVKQGRIVINGIVARSPGDPVLPGQKISLERKQEYVAKGVELLYRDQAIVVVEKSCGILSVASEFDDGRHVHGILKKHLHPSRVFPVHRLDRDTSGVFVFALNEQARDNLKDAFEKHTIERAYTAVVEGVMSNDSGTWESLLYDDRSYTVRITNDPSIGKRAITHYQVIERGRKATLLKLHLETGRKNQIRVHCSAAGHPITGDPKYGSETNPIRRLCLHAHLLGFSHPITGKKMLFESPAPSVFSKALGKRQG